jgi:hypothetical protein
MLSISPAMTGKENFLASKDFKTKLSFSPTSPFTRNVRIAMIAHFEHPWTISSKKAPW